MKSAPVPFARLEAAAAETESTARATPRLEETHVRDVYDRVASQWAGTRYKAWPEVERFVRERVGRGDVVVEVGCGNGKNLPSLARAAGMGVVACDTSVPLCEIAALECPLAEVTTGDIVDLPYRSESFDVLLCIAVLHHLSTPARRRRAMEECARVCVVGARLLFLAWAVEQDDGVSGHAFETQDVFVPFHQRAANLPGFDARVFQPPPDRIDASINHGVLSEEKKAVVFQRYCHVFRRGELEELASGVESLRVVATFKDAGNCLSSSSLVLVGCRRRLTRLVIEGVVVAEKTTTSMTTTRTGTESHFGDSSGRPSR